VYRRLDRCQEPGAHVDAVGTQRQRGHESSCVAEAARGDHRDRDLVRRGGDEHQAGNVVLTWMTGAFEPVDADAVHAQSLRLDGVPDAGALVQDLDPGGPERGQVFGRVESGGLHHRDTGLDDRRPVLRVRRRVDRRQDRQVHAERFVRHVPAPPDLGDQILR